MEKIGVIVTVFNVEQFIQKCLESVLHQTYREIEVIVVDDGSTDSSGEICDRIAEKDNRVMVHHQSNQGVIAARLSGVQKSSADYVTFVDGDDWLDEKLYEDIVAEGVLGKADLVCFGIISCYNGREMQYESCCLQAGIYDTQNIGNCIIPRMLWDVDTNTYGLAPSLCSKIFRRKQLEHHLYNLRELNIHYGEDIAVLYPVILECSLIAVMDECYYYYRKRKSNDIAPYISDAMYFSKLYCLYEYLLGIFQKSQYKEQLTKQLDYFYMYSARLGKLKYGDMAFEEMYIFPFDKVEKGSRLVLYGAGQVGQTFFRQLGKLKYCEVVVWVDRDYSSYQNDIIKGIDAVMTAEYDYILIAIKSDAISLEVKENLEQMGIDDSKIIQYIHKV